MATTPETFTPSPAVLEQAERALAWARAERTVPRSLTFEVEGQEYELEVATGRLTRAVVLGWHLPLAALLEGR